MLAQIHQCRSSRHRRCGRPGQDLAAMTGVHQAGRPVHRRPEIVTVALRNLPGVDPHAGPVPPPLRPALRRQALGVHRRVQGVRGPSKGRRKPVPGRGEHIAAVASMAPRIISSWRATASRMASGADSHNRVEPSISVNKNVTVPDGPLTVQKFSTSRGQATALNPRVKDRLLRFRL